MSDASDLDELPMAYALWTRFLRHNPADPHWSLNGGPYCDAQRLDDALKPDCILALEMNGAALSEIYGAPLRLRVENQLGYKMVKWIERIEFIESEKGIGQGEGGKNEDDEYYGLPPNI